MKYADLYLTTDVKARRKTWSDECYVYSNEGVITFFAPVIGERVYKPSDEDLEATDWITL